MRNNGPMISHSGKCHGFFPRGIIDVGGGVVRMEVLCGDAMVAKKRGKNSSLLCQQRLNMSVWSNEWYH